jgi:hypothetical protein
VVLAALAFSAAAQAQVTIGQLAPANPAVNCAHGAEYDELQSTVASGTGYVVPAPGGVITSWSTNAAAGEGQSMGMKIFRPSDTGTYKVVAHDGPRPLAPSVLNTFAVSIPVQAGDVLGVQNPPTSTVPDACSFRTEDEGDELNYLAGSLADGETFGIEGSEKKVRLNVTASLLPPPSIGAIAPADGSFQGGASVVITGSNFAEVKGVSFGATPASSFVVNSESQVTAIAPASASLTSVPITVTTISGSASSPSTFAYQGCVVPKLAGKKLKAAKKALKKADCKVGKVKKLGKATVKTGKVKKQNPKPRKVLAPGSKVSIKLG